LKKIVFFIIVMLLIISLHTAADRGSIPYTANLKIYEPQQDALIAWNGEEEILILSTELFAEEETKVLQVLPLPSEAEIKKSSRSVIKKAGQFLIDNTVQSFQPLLPSRSAEIEVQPGGEITQEIVIGSHDITAVKVLNSSEFVSWVNDYLEEKGNNNPIIPEDLKPIIENYIERGFNHFVFDTVEVTDEAKYNEAISYKFKTDKLYYPLEITSLDKGESQIELIIVTDQKLINYSGVERDKIEKSLGPIPINIGEAADISENIAGIFSDASAAENKNTEIRIMSWELKDDLANFKDDLLVDGDVSALGGKEMVYRDTRLLGVKRRENYPFPIKEEKELEYLNGRVEIIMGSRMYPWRSYAVNGKALFSAQTGELIKNFGGLDKRITLEGYSGRGSINMRDPIDGFMTTIPIDNAFFVSKIVGWEPYTGLPVSENGEVRENRITFWLEK